MNICKDLYIGRLKTGEKYYLTIELRERTNGVSIDHIDLPYYQELSFTGTLISKYGSLNYLRGYIGGGQNYDDLLLITDPAKGFTKHSIRRIYDLWRAWHLNDMSSHCAHQNNAIKWDEVNPCPITGYSAGSAWLVRELPEGLILELNALVGKVLEEAN